MEEIYPLFTGFAVGALFAFLNLPIPAPEKIGGILGIIGIFLGYVAVKKLIL